MSTGVKKSSSNGNEKSLTPDDHQGKINEVRRLLGPLPEKLTIYCSDASISRYLRARNGNVKKATKMLKETLKWRNEYKPEEIRWEEIAHEAETGKIYRLNFTDRHGRIVLVMRPRCQNSKSNKGQIKHLVYCMENAILNLPPDQDQLVWLIDFQGFSLSNISVKLTKETAHVLQEHYPERLGLAILYNPPKFFEPFWMLVKPFLEPKTCNKVKFVYSDDPNSKKIVEDLFDTEQLEEAFDGNNSSGFNISKYAEKMKEDDKRMPLFWTRGDRESAATQPPLVSDAACLDSLNLNSDLDDSDSEKTESNSLSGVNSKAIGQDENALVTDNGKNDANAGD
ncbi:random slug protein 5 [Carica papaya]|uniref:random slug protein 5 n=1 Tax=Carica papaya TaxID=3649 RepID=UPI000B8C9B65|nr:random slug protein 5 [Carica papaya]XP_021896079.1 random slug protein 5 [Carica papaya]